MKTSRQSGRSFAMIVALLVITMLLVGGALLSQDLVIRARLLREETRELHLQSVLDSAVAQMLAKYRADVYFEGREELAIDGGKAIMDATNVGGTTRRVEIEAEYQGLKRYIEIDIYASPGEAVRLTDHRPASAASESLRDLE